MAWLDRREGGFIRQWPAQRQARGWQIVARHFGSDGGQYGVIKTTERRHRQTVYTAGRGQGRDNDLVE